MKQLRKNNRIIALYCLAAVGVLLVLLAGLLFGSAYLSISELWNAFFRAEETSAAARILWYVRLPRTLAALLCGAALSVSGAVLQKVLANRLASPSIIGVNAGAGLAVTVCSAAGILGGFLLSLYSFLGALAAVLAVSFGAKKWGASGGTVILMGVALNALLGAASDSIVTFFPEVGVMSNAFRVGDFSSVSYRVLVPAAVAVLGALALVFTLASALDVLTLGEDSAKGLGMRTGLFRLLFLVLSAILAGAAVSLAGLLSFVGLLVPHAVRRLGAWQTKHLLPLCALFGAGFVALCDLLSRVIFAPYEIPVGILMAFLGAPFFLIVLIRRRRNDA